MKEKKEDAPFKEGDVKTLEPFHAECPGVIQVFVVKKISGSYKKQRHVKDINEIGYKCGGLGMSHHHKNNGYSLTYRDHCIFRHD